MSITIKATFDGKVFRPSEPVNLPPNTEVELAMEPHAGQPGFLDLADHLTLEGPADWSESIEEILNAGRSGNPLDDPSSHG